VNKLTRLPAAAAIAGRIVARHLGEAWKPPVVVENRPGAGGQIGTQAVVKAEHDGYMLLIQSASHAGNSAIYRSLPSDPLKDLVDVAILGITPAPMKPDEFARFVREQIETYRKIVKQADIQPL
jgi:tripartite-type tricarboxylate transporter receptor subunit TctC